MVINLRKGQQAAIGQLRHITVGLGWDPAETGHDSDLDATAFMLDKNHKIPTPSYFVFYSNLNSPDGACTHTGDDPTGGSSDGDDDEQILVDLTKVAPQILSIVFAASIHDAEIRGKQNFGQVQNAYIRICNTDTGEEICRYELGEDFSTETAVEFGNLILQDGRWRFEATGVGHKGGLQSIVEKYYDGGVTS